MKKYNIVVNGKSYEVEVEDLGGTLGSPASQIPARVEVASIPKPKAPVFIPKTPETIVSPTPAVKPSIVPEPAKQKAVSGSGENEGQASVNAPIPGTVLDILVQTGDSVEAGQIILILEAMKMENEILAPCAGFVASISTVKGAIVNPGDLLATIKQS